MTRKLELPSHRRHIWVFDEDWEFLQRAYGPGSQSRMGVAKATRTIIHAKVRSLKQKIAEAADHRRGFADTVGDIISAQEAADRGIEEEQQ